MWFMMQYVFKTVELQYFPQIFSAKFSGKTQTLMGHMNT